MPITDRMVFTLQVWWVTYGMSAVCCMELLDNNEIASGFIWQDAQNDGYIKSGNDTYALTQKALDLIKEYDYGH